MIVLHVKEQAFVVSATVKGIISLLMAVAHQVEVTHLEAAAIMTTRVKNVQFVMVVENVREEICWLNGVMEQAYADIVMERVLQNTTVSLVNAICVMGLANVIGVMELVNVTHVMVRGINNHLLDTTQRICII